MAANVDIVNRAWDIVVHTLSPGTLAKEPFKFPETEYQNAMEILTQHGKVHLVEENFFEELQWELRQNVSKNFWAYFKPSGDQASSLSNQLLHAVEYLHSVREGYSSCLDRLETIPRDPGRASLMSFCGVTSFSQVMITLIKAILFSHMTKEFQVVVETFYSQAFRVFHHIESEDGQESEEEESSQCSGCQEDTDACRCQEIMEHFHTVNRKLDEIGILEQVSGNSVTALVHKQIEQHVENTCKGTFETAFLEELEKWLETKVVGWLKLVYSGNRTHIGSDCIEGFKGRLLHFLYETYSQVQISQLFNIIIDFPESEPAILDLKTCLEKTDMRSKLVTTLKSSLETRLLHPGVSTTDILTAYISAIRALRVLDPAGVILELVCDPVWKYLRSREDTVRCIVSSLTEDGSNDLLEELQKGQPLVLDGGTHSDEDDEDWEKWMPDPVDADPTTASKSRRASDIISMLVNIYGSKELFVNEYRTLLADRLLSNFNYEIEKEIRYLELLKLRFGESDLHYCEVMLKDIADSKRLNTRIMEERKQKGEVEEVEVNAMVLSQQFWPTFREEKITLPQEMQALLENYTKKFEAQKGNRTLNWKSHLGLVNIDVELKERTLNFAVSPVHAAIIMQFQEQGRWTIEELSSALQMPASAMRRKIAYWQTQGLLKEETTDTFVLVEEHKGRSQDIVLTEDDEKESAMASAHVQREEELQVFWSYIVGMLTNLDTLSLERIHSMLRMFAMQGTSAMECSVQELKAFLDRKVKEQKLTCQSGSYRLAKPN